MDATFWGAAVAGGAAMCSAALLWRAAGERQYPPSYPGGPRASRGSYRTPVWPARKADSVATGWRLATGLESHRVTERAHPDTDAQLTGEAAGRHVWWYDESAAGSEAEEVTTSFDPSSNPNTEDKVFRAAQLARFRERQAAAPGGGVQQEPPPPTTPREAARRGVEFYEQLQCDEGHWGGDYGGPMFLLPGLVIVAYVTGSMETILPRRHREAMIVYLRNHQQSDGGWGTHIESASTMFGSVLCYVSMRLVSKSDEFCIPNEELCIQTRNCVFQTRSCVSKMMNFAAGRARQRYSGHQRARLHPAARRRAVHRFVGKVLAGRAGCLQLGGLEPHPCGDVAPAALLTVSSLAHVVPLPDGLLADGLHLLLPLHLPPRRHRPAHASPEGGALPAPPNSSSTSGIRKLC